MGRCVQVIVLGGGGAANLHGVTQQPQKRCGRRPAANAGRLFNHYSTGAGMWVRASAAFWPNCPCVAVHMEPAPWTSPGIGWARNAVGSPATMAGLSVLHAKWGGWVMTLENSCIADRVHASLAAASLV